MQLQNVVGKVPFPQFPAKHICQRSHAFIQKPLLFQNLPLLFQQCQIVLPVVPDLIEGSGHHIIGRIPGCKGSEGLLQRLDPPGQSLDQLLLRPDLDFQFPAAHHPDSGKDRAQKSQRSGTQGDAAPQELPLHQQQDSCRCQGGSGDQKQDHRQGARLYPGPLGRRILQLSALLPQPADLLQFLLLQPKGLFLRNTR